MVKKSLDGLSKNLPYRAPFTDESSIRNYLSNPQWDAILENGASFALIIGLLGTFLGIGLAIQDASKVIISLNDTIKNPAAASTSSILNTIGSLSPVLSDIGTKFKVSAWGIIAHICIRLITPFFKIESFKKNFLIQKLNEIQQKKELADKEFNNEILKFFKNSIDDNEKILQELKNIGSVPQKIEKSLEEFTDSLTNFHTDIKEFSNDLLNVTSSLKSEVNQSLRDIEQVIKNIDLKANESFNDLNNMVSHVFTDSAQTLKKTNDQVASLMVNIEAILNMDNFNLFNDNISSLQIESKTIASNLDEIIQPLLEAKSFMAAVKNPLLQTLPIVERFLQDNSELIHYIEGNSKLNETLNQSIQENSSFINTMANDLKDLEASISDIQSAIHTTGVPIANIAPIIKDFLQRNLDLSKSFVNSIDNQEQLSQCLEANSSILKSMNHNLLRSNIERQIKLDN